MLLSTIQSQFYHPKHFNAKCKGGICVKVPCSPLICSPFVNATQHDSEAFFWSCVSRYGACMNEACFYCSGRLFQALYGNESVVQVVCVQVCVCRYWWDESGA